IRSSGSSRRSISSTSSPARRATVRARRRQRARRARNRRTLAPSRPFDKVGPMLWGRWLQLGVFAAALGACAIELQGEGDPTFGTPEATPPNPTVDGAVSDDASDCPSCAPGDELVEDSFDDDAHVDRLTSVALDAAGGTVQFPAAIDPGTGADGNCVVTYAVDL